MATKRIFVESCVFTGAKRRTIQGQQGSCIAADLNSAKITTALQTMNEIVPLTCDNSIFFLLHWLERTELDMLGCPRHRYGRARGPWPLPYRAAGRDFLCELRAHSLKSIQTN